MCMSFDETFGEEAVALGLFDASSCAAKFRADLLDVGEQVAATAGPLLMDAATEFARCSLGLPTRKQAAQYLAAHPLAQTAGGESLKGDVAGYVAAYVSWKPPARCMGMIVGCVLTGGSWKECLTQVVACVVADLKTQFGGKIGDLIGGAIGGGSGGTTDWTRPANPPMNPTLPGLGGDSVGGPVTGPGVVRGGRS